MLRVRLLGELELDEDGRALELPSSRRGRELLSWLALHPGPHARSDLAARFWPDVLDTSARASLRTALHELRRALGDEGAAHLVADRERVGLAGDELWVDARAVEELAGNGRPDEALDLCRGELLPGLDEDWVLAARDEHRERVAALLSWLAETAAAEGRSDEAVRLAREQARLDPLSEDAARHLMRHLADAGDRPAAIAAYGRLEERLRRDLGVVPSAATRELAASLRQVEERPAKRLPLPPAASRRERSRLMGREAELERLSTAVRQARERRLLLVSGEPGIGKTRVLSELARAEHERGAAVLFGRCYEEQLAPYGPFADALSWYVSTAGPEAIGGEAEELRRLVPALGDGSSRGPSDPGAARLRLFEAVGSVLNRIAAGGGLLLALDDLHWADRATLFLLRWLIHAPGPPLALVGAYRESELSRRHPLAGVLADLRREGLAERVALHGLSSEEVGELVTAWLGSGTPADLPAAVHDETGGNPFFVEEVLQHLSESGALTRIGIPEGIREVIGRRLSRLSDDTGSVLGAAAVVGREFELALLEALEPLAGIDVLGAVEQAQSAQMVREEPGLAGRYGFVHALIRETVYEELSLTRRVRLHAAVAAALERLADAAADLRLSELAHHHLEAASGADPNTAVDYAMRAARAANRALAYDEAAGFCGRALQALEGLAGHERRHGELLILLGESRLRAGQTAAARQAFETAADVARELGDGQLLGAAALGFSGLGVTIIAVDERAVALLEEALARPSGAPELRAPLTARLAIETYYVSTPQRRKELGDEAVVLARDSRDPLALLDALNSRHAALWSPQYLDERLATADELIALAGEADEPERELQGRNWRVLDLLEGGELAAARQEIEGHEQLADRLRLPSYQWWGPLWRSTLALLEGDIPEGERLIEATRAIGDRAEDENALLYVEIQRHGVAMLCERFEEIPVEVFEREVGRPAEYAYRTGASYFFAEKGDIALARESLEWVCANDFERLGDDMNLLAAMCELAQGMDRLGDGRFAAGVAERLAPFADRHVVNGRGATGYGSAALHLAIATDLAGRHEDARWLFEQALEANSRLGSRPWVARAQERYGQFLIRHGEPARGRELLSQALPVAGELGNERMARRLETALGG